MKFNRLLLLTVSLAPLFAQQAAQTSTSVPRLLRVNGSFHPANGSPAGATESVTLSIYRDEQGGTPLWQEIQNVAIDSEGHYTALLGSTLNDGVPVVLFNSSEPRWLGVRFNRPGEQEQPRTQMASVPYALKASDAETLGGLPASAYLRSPSSDPGYLINAIGTALTPADKTEPRPQTASGTTNCIAVFTDSTDLGCSPMYQSGGSVGLGTTAPGAELDVQTPNSGYVDLLNLKSNYTGGATGAAGMTLAHKNSTMLMRAYAPGAPSNLANSIGWFALSGSNKLLIGHAGTATGNDLAFFTNNQYANPQIVLTNTGNVGVGTSAPFYSMEVDDNGNTVPGGVGLAGISSYAGDSGVFGFSEASSGASNGGTFYTDSPAGTGILAENLSGGGNNYAGYFFGNVEVVGSLTVTGSVGKGSGSFKIDHPLDPANKYLSHSFVESPDMMNVYNGNVTTNQHGLAVVTLPDYFEVLNRDFRYQLTVIGQFSQAIVAKEISRNRFTIKTSRPGVKVSWQVTGIRQDAYANAHRVAVEEAKGPEEQGKYLHPELFGVSEEQAIRYKRSVQPPTTTKNDVTASAVQPRTPR